MGERKLGHRKPKKVVVMVLKFKQLGQAGSDHLRTGHVMPPLRPFANLLLGRAEKSNLKVVHFLFHDFEMFCPQEGLIRAHSFVALPAHSMKKQDAVWGHQSTATGRKQKQGGGRALAQDDRRRVQLAVPQQRHDGQGPVDATPHGVNVKNAFAVGPKGQ